jgi:diguanylate cyclase (GGDEF)-like protein
MIDQANSMIASNESRLILLMDQLVLLSSVRERDALLRQLTSALREAIDAEVVDVFGLVLDENHHFWLHLTQDSRGSGVRVVCDTLHADSTNLQAVDDVPDRKRCVDTTSVLASTIEGEAAGFLTRFPIMLANGSFAWGVAEIRSTRALEPLDTGAATRLISMYANILEMLDYSERDALTGLWNRKSFDDLFYKAISPAEPDLPLAPEEEKRALSTASRFWLAMVDIDHFKLVNDNYGHLIGDDVLLLVAQLLKGSFRAHDRVYRFGGEEFMVVLRCDDHDSANAALERFRARMEGHDFPQAGRITASVGFTEIQASDSPNVACERADKAVYYAKRNGRNQVCSEGDLVKRGLLSTDVIVGDMELF